VSWGLLCVVGFSAGKLIISRVKYGWSFFSTKKAGKSQSAFDTQAWESAMELPITSVCDGRFVIYLVCVVPTSILNQSPFNGNNRGLCTFKRFVLFAMS
jgi:hypothetical protein